MTNVSRCGGQGDIGGDRHRRETWKNEEDTRACSSASLVPDSLQPWTVVHQAPLSMGFSRQEYWSGLPSPPPGNLPHPGTKPASLTPPALADRFFSTGAAWDALMSRT